MPETTNNQPSIVDEIIGKITDIKDKIKEGGLSQTAFNELTNNAKLLQDKLNLLLNNKGFYNNTEVNDAYETLREVKRKEFESETKKARNKAIMYLGIGLLVVIGGYIYFKKK
jgi:hypothetical protein